MLTFMPFLSKIHTSTKVRLELTFVLSSYNLFMQYRLHIGDYTRNDIVEGVAYLMIR